MCVCFVSPWTFQILTTVNFLGGSFRPLQHIVYILYIYKRLRRNTVHRLSARVPLFGTLLQHIIIIIIIILHITRICVHQTWRRRRRRHTCCCGGPRMEFHKNTFPLVRVPTAADPFSSDVCSSERYIIMYYIYLLQIVKRIRKRSCLEIRTLCIFWLHMMYTRHFIIYRALWVSSAYKYNSAAECCSVFVSLRQRRQI